MRYAHHQSHWQHSAMSKYEESEFQSLLNVGRNLNVNCSTSKSTKMYILYTVLYEYDLKIKIVHGLKG